MIADFRWLHPVLAAVVVVPLAAAVPEARAAVRVPPGFAVHGYASGLPEATALALAPNGRLYVTTKGGSVFTVRRPGAAPTRFASGLRDSTLGVVWHRGAVYVSDLGRVVRFSDRDADGTPESGPTTIVGGLPQQRHQNDNVVAGPDGRLYLGVGSTCDVCRERDPRSATILSFRPDGGDVRIVARGLRNPYGLAFDARGRLWASDEGRDQPEGVPEELNRIERGRHYGWPSCWGRGGGSGCRGTAPASVVLEPHSAATGVTFAGDGWGRGYRGDAFVAHWGTYVGREHGRYVSRIRFTPRGPKVSRFATGLEHPIATLFTPRGALLVADFGTGRIWSITRERTAPARRAVAPPARRPAAAAARAAPRTWRLRPAEVGACPSRGAWRARTRRAPARHATPPADGALFATDLRCLTRDLASRP